MSESIFFVMPEIILVAGAVAVLMGGVFGLHRTGIGLLAVGFSAAAMAVLFLNPHPPMEFFSGMVVNDPLGFWGRSFVLLAAMMTLALSLAHRWFDDEDLGEYFFFILSSAVALMFAVSSRNLVMIYLGVETLSVISYVLAAYFKKELASTESGIKYFLFGALATGLMLYGISLIYGLCGTFDLPGIGQRLASGDLPFSMVAVAGILIFAGIAFKAALAPFHMWVADVYEGAPWPVAAFFSVGPKALGFVLLVRVFFSGSEGICPSWNMLLLILAVLTMTVGNLSAFQQSSVKRVLAFSSVAHAGYILAAMAIGSAGLPAAFLYIVIYLFMNFGAFAAAALLSPTRHDENAFKGMGRRSPGVAAALAICLLSLAGLPPLAGFAGKLILLWTILGSAGYFLAAVVLFNSLIAFFYYLKIIKVMYFDGGEDVPAPQVSFLGRVLVYGCTAAVIVLGLYSRPVTDLMSLIFR